MKTPILKLLAAAAASVGDRRCPLCQALLSEEDTVFCQTCLAQLTEETALPCSLCGCPAPACTCQDTTLSPLPVFLHNRSWAAHTWYLHAREERRTEAMLLRCKEHYSPALSAYIAQTMAADLAKLLPEDQRRRWILTCAPRSLQGFDKHGFDQCWEIVRQMGRLLHIPVRRMLVRVGGGEQKAMDTAGRREDNIAGAFLACRVPKECRVLLFDDIITTGATMREAGRVLAEAGAAAVFPIAYAKTMRLGK